MQWLKSETRNANRLPLSLTFAALNRLMLDAARECHRAMRADFRTLLGVKKLRYTVIVQTEQTAGAVVAQNVTQN